MKKIIALLLVGAFVTPCTIASEVSKYINKMNFGNTAKTSVLIADIDKNCVIYKRNENDPLNPASVLKLLTFGCAYKILGKGYKFETELLQDASKNIYVKLGADVLLAQDDLNTLISHLKNIEFNEIFIDDSIFDNEKYPTTWLEEDKWPTQGAITPYIIDKNIVEIGIKRSSLTKSVDIIQGNEYKIPIINELKIGEAQDIKILRLYGENSSIVNLQGYVEKDEVISLPVLNPEINFNIKLNKALKKNKIVHSNCICAKKTPSDVKKIASVSHNIEEISKLILYNSDNYATEVVLKVAAAKYFAKDKVSFEDVIDILEKNYSLYLSQNERFADASGVSRYNLLTTKTIYNALVELLKRDDFKNLMQSANQGTMSERLLFLQDNLKVKTGTMRDLSSICANFKTRKNTNILLVSIVQDAKIRKSLLKNFENTLIGKVYKEY